MSAPLHLRSVSVAIGPRILVPPLDLTVAPGDIVTLMGPSGSGKSTLLAFIGGFLERVFTARGEVLLGDRIITGLRPEERQVATLFQDDLLFPHLSVAGNLAFGLARKGRSRAERSRIIASALSEAGLAGFESRDPTTLSGGQRARVALLRTLLAEPKALLLDEPFGKLDQNLRQGVRSFVFDHVRRHGLPVLLVTHDPDDAQAAGGRVVELGTSSGASLPGSAR